LATCIAGGPTLGYFIDRWLDTAPAFTLAGLALGLVIGFVGAYRMITETLRDMERDAAQKLAAKKKNDNV
jgi:F0F1-type ATP synthase assembly protein I